MRLLLHRTLITAPFTVPLSAGWVSPAPGVTVEMRDQLRGADLDERDAALLPAAELSVVGATYRVVPDAAVVSEAVGAIAMRTPVRPDEVERGPVRLWGTSGAGEVLARATVRPFYGIEPTAWVREGEEAAEAQVVIVEGAEALRPPEAGYAEDLCRAWFILTGMPVVSHVLVVPEGTERDALAPVSWLFSALRAVSHERRRELRGTVAEADKLSLDRVVPTLAAQRLALEEGDRRALLALLQRGSRGSQYPPLTEVRFLEPETLGSASDPAGK